MKIAQKTKIWRIIRNHCPEASLYEVMDILEYITKKANGKFPEAKRLADNPYRIAGRVSW